MILARGQLYEHSCQEEILQRMGSEIDAARTQKSLPADTVVAALDALADEHKYPDKLVSLPNCILTPHAGAATKEAVSRMSYMAAENLIEVLKTGKCRYAV